MLSDEKLEKLLNEIREALAYILKSAIDQKMIPPEEQQRLLLKVERLKKTIERSMGGDEDISNILRIMLLLRILEGWGGKR